MATCGRSRHFGRIVGRPEVKFRLARFSTKTELRKISCFVACPSDEVAGTVTNPLMCCRTRTFYGWLRFTLVTRHVALVLETVDPGGGARIYVLLSDR